MTINSLSPAFVVLHYTSEFAPHVATIPTRDWIVPTSGHPQGSYVAWDSSTIDADTMISQLVGASKALFPSTVTFTTYEIFTMATPTAPKLPRAGNTLALVGTDGTPGWYKAVEKVLTLFDTAFERVNLDFLDCASHNLFDSREAGFFSAGEAATIAEFTAVTNAWSSRAGNQPITPRKITTNLNQELRKQYHMI